MNCVMIILNYNDSNRAWNLAERCNSYKNIDKVIIVDNCSSDDSLDFFSKKNQEGKIDIVNSQENNGFASGNNIGARYALKKYHPSYILFANTDTIFQENDVEACLRKLNDDKNLGLISMRMKNIKGYEERAAWRFMPFYEHLIFNFWIYRHFNREKYTYKKFDGDFQYVDVVRGSFLMFRAEAFSTAGYFDENTFLYYEEDIISYRLRKANYKIGILTNHFYIHNHVYSKKENNSVTKHHSDSSQKYFLVNYYKINRLKEIILDFCILLGNIERFFINKLDRRKLK